MTATKPALTPAKAASAASRAAQTTAKGALSAVEMISTAVRSRLQRLWGRGGGVTVQDIFDFLAAWNAGC
jgi:hypothetical protein